MKTNNWNDLGDQIKNAVDYAIYSGDFQHLSRSIGDIVNTTIDTVKTNIKDNIPHAQNSASSAQTVSSGYSQTTSARTGSRTDIPALYVKKPRGRVSGILLTVFGFLFMGISLLCMIPFAILGLAGHVLLFPLILTAAFAAAGAILGANGIRQLRFAGRFSRYIHNIGDHIYISLRSLADKTGKSVEFTARDLQKMIKQRLFFEGHLDTDEGYLILSDKAYEEYLTEKSAYALRQKEMKKFEENTKLSDECRKIIEDGKKYIQHIHTCNDLIPDEAISAKLDKMEQVVTRIFDEVQRHPEVAEDLHKMMDYYLPTTSKLLDAYRDLDAQPIEGENISSTKREIEATLDTLNTAFEKLLDSLFADRAWDISSDISVLNTVLAQEGLTENDFKKTSDK